MFKARKQLYVSLFGSIGYPAFTISVCLAIFCILFNINIKDAFWRVGIYLIVLVDALVVFRMLTRTFVYSNGVLEVETFWGKRLSIKKESVIRIEQFSVGPSLAKFTISKIVYRINNTIEWQWLYGYNSKDIHYLNMLIKKEMEEEGRSA